jgi:HEAT repeat protein
MDKIDSVIQLFHPAYYLAAAALIALLLFSFLYRWTLRRKLEKEANACAQLHPAFRDTCSFSLSRRLLDLNFRYLRSLSRKYGINLVVLSRLDDFWIEKLEQRPRTKLINRILSYSPEKGLFPCFAQSLSRPRFRSLLREWVDKSGEFMIMRTVARSCNGRPFDGSAVLEFYGDFKEELFEMMGDHEWTSRWFACRILIHDTEERSLRALWESFDDTSYRVRETAVRLFNPPGAEKKEGKKRKSLYTKILSLLLDDPEYRVRRAARSRIEKDFTELYTIPKETTEIQKLHLAELLDPALEEDRRFAFTLLEGENDELSFEASRLLSQAGALTKLFREVFHEDKTSVERAGVLLDHAARVHSTGFLSALEESSNPGSLLLATKILSSYGDRKHITTLVQKVRGFVEKQKRTSPMREIYLAALECACKRGDDTALHLVAHELADRLNDAGLHEHILPLLPVERAHVFVSRLNDFLGDPGYAAKGPLREILSRIDPSFTLHYLFSLIKAEKREVHPTVQEEGLKVLCELQLPYAIQHLLENLPLLSLSQAHRYAEFIASYNEKTYKERAAYLLSRSDARIRSRLISSLPKKHLSHFRRMILDSLTDPDPDVRSACAWTLVSKGGKDDHKAVLSLLHDPVHRVRVHTARAVASCAAAESRAEVEKLLIDPNELPPVKRSAVEGLAESRDEKSVDLLITLLKSDSELEKEAVLALSKKTGTVMINRILSHIEKADAKLRTLLVQALKSMGESSETVLESLVFDLDSPLRAVTIEILGSIGSVDNRIRHLTNRDVSVRREAADFLSHVGTKNAYRGLVLAAKDPDEEVRSHVVKALDALDSDKGRGLLEELKSDPDRRVRTLTEWAIERHTARKL